MAIGNHGISEEGLTAFAVDLPKLATKDGEGAGKLVIVIFDVSTRVLVFVVFLIVMQGVRT